MITSQVISKGTEQDSVLITATQLKETNLIFVEHQKLLEENTLLYKQLENYKVDNELLIQKDSLRQKQIVNYELMSESYNNQISELNKQIKKKNKNLLIWKIGGVTVATSFLLFMLLK